MTRIFQRKHPRPAARNHLDPAEKIAFITGWVVGLAAGFVLFLHWFGILASVLLAFAPATVGCFLFGFAASWHRRRRELVEQASAAPQAPPPTPEDLEHALDEAVRASSSRTRQKT